VLADPLESRLASPLALLRRLRGLCLGDRKFLFLRNVYLVESVVNAVVAASEGTMDSHRGAGRARNKPEIDRERATQAAADRAETLLRIASVFASHSDPDRLIADLLEEAVALVGADDGMVTAKDPAAGSTHRYSSRTNTPLPLRPPREASTQAVERRAPVIVNHDELAAQTGEGEAARAAVAVPLLYEERLLGALVVQGYETGKRFDADDAKALATIAGLAAAALVALERARIEAVELTARTVQHELINKLALTTGYVQLLSSDASLPSHLRKAAAEALEGARSAVEILNQLQALTHLEEKAWGGQMQPTIDLERSIGSRAEG
jgi:GAF domain-containing protein